MAVAKHILENGRERVTMSLRKPRRQRKRERRQTKGLMSKTMAGPLALHNYWYIYLLSSAKRQRTMIKFYVVGERRSRRQLLLFLFRPVPDSIS